MRKLASVVKLDDVVVHPNADKMELAIIGGWQCCVQKDEFKKGDLAVYLEIDSMLPVEHPDFAFLVARGGLKEIDGKCYSRIRTIKLRKEISQGLIIPIPATIKNPKLGDDLTEKLGVLKYEKPEAGVTSVGGKPLGNGYFDRLVKLIIGSSESGMKPWPSFIQKTDQERVQNCTRAFYDAKKDGEEFEVTYKLDGSSWTAFIKDGKTGVCSRNWQLQTEDIVWTKTQQYRQWLGEFLMSNRKFFKKWKLRFPELKTGIKVEGNNFVKMFEQYDVAAKLKSLKEHGFTNIALQGEMIGPSIQGNFEGNPELDLYIFSVYDIDKKAYFLPQNAKQIVEIIGMKYVPIFNERATLPESVKDCLDMAEGDPAFMTDHEKQFGTKRYREGLVFKSLTRDFSFKAISNSYLLKNDG